MLNEDLTQVNKFKLVNADNKTVLPSLSDHSVDAIITDPPYNISQYSTGDIKIKGRSSIQNSMGSWDYDNLDIDYLTSEFKRVLKPQGNLVIFTSYNQLGLWHQRLDHIFDTFQVFFWHKTNPVPKFRNAGFLNSVEMVVFCWNKGHTWNYLGHKKMHNHFESPICMGNERVKNPKHPAQKPLKLMSHLVEVATNETDLILDPFSGLGSTGVAAIELKRRYIGIEVDAGYHLAAERRINDLRPQ